MSFSDKSKKLRRGFIFLRCWFLKCTMLRILILSSLALPALSQERHALVIGIDSYDALDDLSRARADALAMEQSLQDLGFLVETLLDPPRRELMFALIDLQSRIAPGDTVAVFFAGHGVEDGGRNFLLPADTPALRDRADLPGAAVALDDLRDMLHLRRPGVVLMFIDACRDNPLPTDASGTRSVGGSRGLARPDTAEGTFILFAAAARQAAWDHLGPSDSDPNSVFTRVLLRELARPGLSIQEIGQRTGLKVTRLAAAAGFTQRPEYMDGVLAPFRLREAAAAEPALLSAGAADPCASALPVWSAIQNSDSLAALEQFTATYASSCATLAALAQERLAGLQQVASDTPRSEPDPAARMAACDAVGNPEVVPFARLQVSDLERARGLCQAARDAAPDRSSPEFIRATAWLGRILDAANDHDAAVPHFEFAASAGNASAMNSLGVMYNEGLGVAQSDAEAIRWYRASAEAGNANGMANLGVMYKDGRGVMQDHAEAVRWYRASAESGSASGARNLADMYDHGNGVARDPKQAAELFLAAERGGDDWFRRNTASRNRETIREVQRLLATAGHYSGALDGYWGPASRAALNAHVTQR